MRLFSFLHQDQRKFGLAMSTGVVDLSSRLEGRYADLRSLLEAEALEEAHNFSDERYVDYSFSEIQFLPVIHNPDKIICVGLNYDDHRREVNKQTSDYPTIFTRLPSSQVGHNAPIVIPKESKCLDYEGEIAVVIGKRGRRIPESQANAFIAGFACYNDASIRDWQLHTPQWSPGKNFDSTGAFGPWMVTKDEFKDNEILTLETKLNGLIMQRATTDMLLFSIPRLINYISSFTTLQPGDVIVTGTPGGVGFKRNPPVYMKSGDIVEVSVSGIGTLRNVVMEEE